VTADHTLSAHLHSGLIGWWLNCNHHEGEYSHHEGDCWVRGWWDNVHIDDIRFDGDWPDPLPSPCPVLPVFDDGLVFVYDGEHPGRIVVRTLDVAPTDDGWIALPPDTEVPAVGDVVAVVERCEMCAAGWCDLAGWEGHGWLRLGFVRVLEVLPIVTDLTARAIRRAPFVWANRDGWVESFDDAGRSLGPLTLPDAVPGGVALRVEWTAA